METTPLFGSNYYIYDGSATELNCTQADHLQWTYNAGTFLMGAAYMYNYVGELFPTLVENHIDRDSEFYRQMALPHGVPALKGSLMERLFSSHLTAIIT